MSEDFPPELRDPDRAHVDLRTGAPRSTPVDWPSAGPIDLDIHDLPHHSSTVEWWYVHTHLESPDGRPFSLFASFFRARDTRDKDSGETPPPSHFMVWGVVDVAAGRYLSGTLLDPRTPRDALRQLDDGHGPKDPRVHRALREVFARGNVPLPDRLLAGEPLVAEDRLFIDLDGNRFEKLLDGRYELELCDPAGQIECRLRFSLEKPAIRHGDDGIVAGFTAKRMFYYFVPRCTVEGTIRVDGVDDAERLTVSGSGWYDHEFGNDGGEQGEDVAWNWLAAQLDGNRELSVYETFNGPVKDRKTLERRVVMIDAQGERHVYRDFTFEPSGYWTSVRTFATYPTKWRLEVPGPGIFLDVEAELPAQELGTILSPPAFWEGRMRIDGSIAGAPTSGLGFVELSGFANVEDLDDFFSAVGQETRRQIDVLLPDTPTEQDARRLLANGIGTAHYVDGLDLERVASTLLRPIREVVLRGGKAWRSFAVLASLDVVGGDSERFRHWLALPELLHSGSLIVDDVEDHSDVRRGGPACHTVYGEALAINAGTACYFLSQVAILHEEGDPKKMIRAYECFFEAMRMAHVGQALDISGLDHLMPAAIEGSGAALLEKRLLTTHLLKSAAPPAALARMAAYAAGATDEQMERTAALFESFGLAFQIVDDVLNLRGFQGDLKTRGEDITAGKITAPVAKAMTLLPLEERRWLWETLRSKPTERAVIEKVIEKLEGCGALDACQAQARKLVEDAWRRLDPLVPASNAKVMLRAFGWFVLERHY